MQFYVHILVPLAGSFNVSQEHNVIKLRVKPRPLWSAPEPVHQSGVQLGSDFLIIGWLYFAIERNAGWMIAFPTHRKTPGILHNYLRSTKVKTLIIKRQH